MRARLLLPVLAVALAVTACGGTEDAAPPRQPPVTEKADLGVALPAAVADRGALAVGVKCDYPPFGYIDEAGENAGFEIDIARRLAGYAFGDEGKVELTCVTGSNRVPFLTTNRIDLIMATMNFTPERAETIDFTAPYFAGGVKMLVPADSPIGGWDDLSGHSVITIKGSTASLWLTECLPEVEQVPFEQTSEALTALRQERADAFAQDDTLLVDLAKKTSGTKVVGEVRADSPWGMGVRKGDAEMLAWVDAAIAKMRAGDEFWTAFTGAITDEAVQQEFAKVLPRPDNELSYPTGPIIEC
ncbi:transporter substrate-binding domain-containing protein [Actinophytocola sediminis]